MSQIELILIAIGLAMDCFAVSFSSGTSNKILTFKNILLIAFFFGLFQGVMPLIGWFAGEKVVDKIDHFDHWISFAILVFIGGKMVYEALMSGNAEKPVNILKFSTLIIFSIATSIDALAVGFSFAMAQTTFIWIPVLYIGIASFLLSIIGCYSGKKLSQVVKPVYAEILGGAILIIIGSKILIEHLVG
ncbi:MAG: manganese efflux pump MntP family protein [Bacteroidales bacterium]|jgi:putative Mn2+ efflux pump MntP|nr:manganese efflux pump MntP family protein [Bacteroidales bacterium]